MERYTVAIAPYGKREKIRLLVPFLSTASVSAFVDEIKQRIARLTSWSSLAESAEILLHLEENGPLLDGYDTLSDAVLDPRTETIHVSISPAPRDKPSQAIDSVSAVLCKQPPHEQDCTLHSSACELVATASSAGIRSLWKDEMLTDLPTGACARNPKSF